MAALGNVLLAWFNACLSWKVVWQSDSDLLDGSDGGVLLHQTRGTDPAMINDCATSLWRRKRPSKQIHPWLSSHLTHSLINTASSFNQYLLCRLIVAKKSLQGKGKKTHTHTQWGHVRDRDPVEAYSLWSTGCASQLKMNYGDLTQVTYWLHTLFRIVVHFKLLRDTKFHLKWLESIFKTQYDLCSML